MYRIPFIHGFIIPFQNFFRRIQIFQKDGAAKLSITDTGIGINATDQPYIFDRFFRCDPSRSTPGSGLGLSLVKAVAEAHSGHVKVSSKMGEGSSFQVIIPV